MKMYKITADVCLYAVMADTMTDVKDFVLDTSNKENGIWKMYSITGEPCRQISDFKYRHVCKHYA